VELGVKVGVKVGIKLGVELGDARRADILGRPIKISLAALIYRLRHFNFFLSLESDGGVSSSFLY
jgi:hypothetical protein